MRRQASALRAMARLIKLADVEPVADAGTTLVGMIVALELCTAIKNGNAPFFRLCGRAPQSIRPGTGLHDCGERRPRKLANSRWGAYIGSAVLSIWLSRVCHHEAVRPLAARLYLCP